MAIYQITNLATYNEVVERIRRNDPEVTGIQFLRYSPDDNLSDLAGVLKENRTITSIDLHGNNVRDDGAIALADALKENRTITSINLGNSGVGNAGAIALADALKVNRTITKIDLSSNKIDKTRQHSIH